MTDAATEARWDRDRDLRKHDGPRPHDPPLPARLDKPLTTAMDIVVSVKAMDNYTAAAALIEQHARATAAAIPLDRRCGVAKLVGYCEGLVSSGLLGEELETKLRRNIAEVLAAFDMPSKAECSDV